MNQIIEETGYSKASVSFWTRDIVLTEAQRNKISRRGRSMESIERRRASRIFNISKKRQTIIDSAKKDFSDITIRELKLIGAMIYWGEGRKVGNWSVSLANSDPLIIKVMMRFFREVCNVQEEKFRAHVHTFEGVSIPKVEKYLVYRQNNSIRLILNQAVQVYRKGKHCHMELWMFMYTIQNYFSLLKVGLKKL